MSNQFNQRDLRHMQSLAGVNEGAPQSIDQKSLITEATVPKTSIYGAVGSVAMPDLQKVLSKTISAKYLKFRKPQSAGLGLWVIEFKGFSRSDFEVDGYVELVAPGGQIKTWSVGVKVAEASKGQMQESWTFMEHEDWRQTMQRAADWLKAWIEI